MNPISSFHLNASNAMKHQKNHQKKHQNGMALIFVLIMMTMVFSIAAISSRIATTGERAARADRDRQMALQSAELALSDAELDIMEPNSARGCKFPAKVYAEPGCSFDSESRGVCSRDLTQPDVPLYNIVNFLEEDESLRRYVRVGEFTDREGFNLANEVSGGVEVAVLGGAAVKPRYIIERVTSSGGGYGLNSAGQAIPLGKAPPMYLVTAVGFGFSRNTRVVLQSLVSKPTLPVECPEGS